MFAERSRNDLLTSTPLSQRQIYLGVGIKLGARTNQKWYAQNTLPALSCLFSLHLDNVGQTADPVQNLAPLADILALDGQVQVGRKIGVRV